MALNATEKTALEQLSADLETASTWMDGERSSYLLDLASKAQAIATGDVDEAAVKAKAEADARLAEAQEALERDAAAAAKAAAAAEKKAAADKQS